MAECIYMGGVACLTHHSARHDEEQVDCDRALLEDAEAAIQRVRGVHQWVVDDEDDPWQVSFATGWDAALADVRRALDGGAE